MGNFINWIMGHKYVPNTPTPGTTKHNTTIKHGYRIAKYKLNQMIQAGQQKLGSSILSRIEGGTRKKRSK